MGRRWGNILLVVVSVIACTAAAEFFARYLDADNDQSPAARHAAEIPLAAGVDRGWFSLDPPPLPNRKAASHEALELVRAVERSGITEGTRRADMFKAWNARFVGDPCRHSYLCGAPGRIYVYDPANGEARPPYRFLPDTTTPIGLVTNAYGFRGAPVPAERRPRTIRIAFIGASTTVGNHYYPWSYPDFVGNWLNLWAAARRLDVTFEILNAGRESITSSDNVVIVRDEVMPLQPDLLVYYEGANQFNLRTMMRDAGPRRDTYLAPGESCPARPAQATGGSPAAQSSWLDDLAYDSALARRLQALRRASQPGASGAEPAKPDYSLVWPSGIDEKNPDIARPDLPINLPTILRDLDTIRQEAATEGAELVLASFLWLVRDGMVLDPIRHRSILDYLNQGYAPFRYADLERMAAFQNRVFARYAEVHHIDFIDVVQRMPFDPDLYIDAIHNSLAGERVRAWIFFQGLVPIVERHLKDGTWPRRPGPAKRPPPTFSPRVLTFDCSKS